MLLFIALICCFSSCKKEGRKNVETGSFFTTGGESISLDAIEKKWNERLSKKEDIEAHITNLELKHIQDKKTHATPTILLGTTNLESVKTACVLIPFQDGYQLGNITITCVNCEHQSTPILYDGKWACQSPENHTHDCTKITSVEES